MQKQPEQNLFAKEFDLYRVFNIPADARFNSIAESRRAFYHGAWTFYQMISRADGADLGAMGELASEIRKVMARMEEDLQSATGAAGGKK